MLLILLVGSFLAGPLLPFASLDAPSPTPKRAEGVEVAEEVEVAALMVATVEAAGVATVGGAIGVALAGAPAGPARRVVEAKSQGDTASGVRIPTRHTTP